MSGSTAGKGATWTTALRAATTPEELAAAITEETAKLGDSVPIATVKAALEELGGEALRAKTELKTATKAREVLLASIAHDLRNPLNTFAMSIGLLRDDVEGDSVDKKRALSLVGRMDRASARMQASIEDLLEASRIEAGTIDFTLRAESAAALARAAIAKAKPQVTEKGAALEEGAIDEKATVLVDKARIVAAFDKLVTVALRFTGEGGAIRLGVEHAGGRVSFALRTTPPRGAPMTASHDEGRAGLSLLIARGLVTAQGGTLTNTMEPTGPCTTVSFPEHAG